MNKISLKNKIIIFLIFLYCVLAYRDCTSRDKIKIRKKEAIAEITEAYSAYRGGLQINYKFKIDEGYILGGTVANTSGGNDKVFLGKIFPIVYDSVDPSFNKILIFPNEFMEYGMTFPDSLEWVNKYRRF